MTPAGRSADTPRIWADWAQRDAAGRVWTFAADSDRPERLRPGILVRAGPSDDIRAAVVVEVVTEPWRTVVVLQEVPPDADRSQ